MNLADWLPSFYPPPPPPPPPELIATITTSSSAAALAAAAAAVAAASFGTAVYCAATRGCKRKAEPIEPQNKRQRAKPKRISTATDANITISRDVDGKVDDAIEDHHHRRIQISFLQFLAYWNEGCAVSPSDTTHQHGRAEGYKGRYQACHSGLQPGVKDDAAARLRNQSRWVRSGRQLRLMGLQPQLPPLLSTARLTNALFWIVKNLAPFETAEEVHLTQRSRIYEDDSQIHALANSTVVLEHVNRFDCCIESDLRPKWIELANRSSQKGEHPYNLVVELVKMMEEVLVEKEGYLKKVKQDLRLMRSLEQELKRYEGEWKRGHRPLKEYLELLAKVTEAHKQLDQVILWKYDTGELKTTGRLPHHFVLQEKKIIPLYNKAKNSVRSAKGFSQKCTYLNQWATYLKGEETTHPSVERFASISKLKAEQEGKKKTHEEQSDWIDVRGEMNGARKEFEETWNELKNALHDPYLCIIVSSAEQNLLSTVRNQLAAAGDHWEPPSLDAHMEVLDEAESTRKKYLNANVIPKPKELYGNADGSLPSPAELMEMKEQLFKKVPGCHGSPSS